MERAEVTRVIIFPDSVKMQGGFARDYGIPALHDGMNANHFPGDCIGFRVSHN